MVDTITKLITRTLELDDAATPGPWHVCGGSECTVLVSEATGDTSDADFQLMDEYRTAAPLLAKECQRLQDLHRPRDTRKGEWPEEGQEIMMWDGHYWKAGWLGTLPQSGCHWLPAPPSSDNQS